MEVRKGQRPRGMGSVVPIPGVMPGVPWSMDGGHFPGCDVVSWLWPYEDAQDSQKSH